MNFAKFVRTSFKQKIPETSSENRKGTKSLIISGIP